MTDVERQVVGFIATKFGMKEEDIALEAPIFGIMGADSLDAVELLIRLEDEFGVEIPDEVATQLRTVEDVIDCLALASAGKQQTGPSFPPAPKPL